jgi:hypothetical protein
MSVSARRNPSTALLLTHLVLDCATLVKAEFETFLSKNHEFKKLQSNLYDVKEIIRGHLNNGAIKEYKQDFQEAVDYIEKLLQNSNARTCVDQPSTSSSAYLAVQPSTSQKASEIVSKKLKRIKQDKTKEFQHRPEFRSETRQNPKHYIQESFAVDAAKLIQETSKV